VYERLGRPSEAIVEAERALVINPRFVNALLLLAQLYARTDRSADAVARLEEAIAAGGDYPDIHYLLGRLCQWMGSIDRARSSYRRALELNAQYQEAREALAALAA
jgi:superkiller protein 3